MTTEVANVFYDLPRSVLKDLLAKYRLVAGAKHTPSIRSVRSVTAYLGHRQRSKPKYGTDVVDESIQQIAEKCEISESGVSDVLRFLEWTGLITTLRRGGGRRKLPTVRRLNIDAARHLHHGIQSELIGFGSDLHGKGADLHGLFPETPRELPRYLPRVNTSNKKKFEFDGPFNEEDFIEEEFGVTPIDVRMLLSEEDSERVSATFRPGSEPF